MDRYASAQAAMQQLAVDHASPGSLNEATTRIRVIDRILLDGLAWRTMDIDTELGGTDGYVDYALGSPIPQAIVEAKREGIHFTIPAGLESRRKIDLRTLMADPATKKAIEQVLTYCQARGVPIAVVTNGHQLIAFYASRQDGIRPLAGEALCFHSLHEMAEDFSVFWAMLSRHGMAQRNLLRHLAVGNRQPLPPAKLSSSITSYPGLRARGALDTNLQMLGNAFIRDIEGPQQASDEFYEFCYCNTGALSQYALVSKEVLRERYAATISTTGADLAPVRQKRGKLHPELGSSLTRAMQSSPLIILGDVGVGKTMFLQHLIRVEGRDLLEDTLAFYIDFGAKGTFEDFESFVYAEISRQLTEDYDVEITEVSFVRAVYNREINQFARGIYGALKASQPDIYALKEAEELERLVSSRDHVLRSLRHLNSRYALVAILDNIDQWPIEDQGRVFLIGQALAAQWPVTVFISLRPATFFNSRSTGTLSAYHLRVFTVAPPRVDEVILRRLEYARELASRQTHLPEALQFSIDDVGAYLDMLEASFGNSEQLRELVDNLSGGNTRRAISMLSRFVGSPYVNTERVLTEARNGRRYTVPAHEFLRAVVLGDYAQYDPTKSEIVNVFDISVEDGREHFLLPALLSYIRGRDEGRGAFVEVGVIYAEFGALGFSQEQIAYHLERAVRYSLLDSSMDGTAGPYRTNQLGAYTEARLPAFFSYIDAIIVDTPIVRSSTRREIRDARTFDERVSRAVMFVDYLDQEWTGAGMETVYAWDRISATLRSDIDDAVRRRDRARGMAGS
ncbi:hypothetical protein J1G43_18150 [Cellulomonas sp. zg-ZUI22]|uniref:hypothetical protein n=1 Tax=Cellulomonas sp. zg-ZUI22 TaxID=2816955 RepID=UPI001A9479E2|nr:hypothetical protein [Cellulomonas sp. zg-ZUI22]MBO0901887.1 hypothetical protein [Cellulomonas sp. zg-ZUI22]